MNSQQPDQMSHEALVAEVARLNRIIQVLMDRSERGLDNQGSDFGLFQTALTLERKVEERNRELKEAVEQNEAVARELYRMTHQMHAEIEERRQSERLREQQNEILEMIASYHPLNEVLHKLVAQMEEELDVAAVSVVLVDDTVSAIAETVADRLPGDYCQALVGIPIGPSSGSCGTAMHRGEPVVVTDIATDPLWADYRDLALAYDLRACWSTPITTSRGEMLGSFAIYHNTPHDPSEREQRLVAGAVYLAGIAIQRSRDEARIRYMAHHDSLTGLPNRTLLQDRMELAVQQAKRAGLRTAVFMIDLDRFKHVNDSLGHHVGDRLLREVAERLVRCVRASDTVARLGGDEFVVSMPDLGRDDSIPIVAGKIMEALEAPFLMRGQKFQLGASIGISLYPEDAANVHDLLRTADTAMYAAKDEGRGNYRYFTDALNQAAHDRMTLVAELQRAIREEEFELFYQPQFRLCDGRLSGAEALLRWHHPERGILGPGDFMDVLEEHGMLSDVGAWVLRAACEQHVAWQRQGLPAIPVAVNVAADQFYRGAVVTQVYMALRDSGMDPSQLTLEFTETVLLRDSERVLVAMDQLRSMGVRLALDDFGTGYSSLAYLHRFPVHELKIDRSFIQSLDEEQVTGNIVDSILHLARGLGLRTVAEGLETAAQQALMRRLECSEGQGFYLARPMPASELRALVKEHLSILS